MYYDPEFIKLRLTDLVSHTDMDKRYSQVHFVSLDMKGCICYFVKWQIHPFISKATTYISIYIV